MKFLDTGIFIEALLGTREAKREVSRPFRTSDLNAAELAAVLMRRGKSVTPALSLLPNALPLDRDAVLFAALVKSARDRSLKRRGRPNMSWVDAAGYVLARKGGMEFVTTDRSTFEGLAGVRFL